MKAVILAAGSATRLRPLTNDLPKCLLSIGDTTILGLTLDNLAAHGLTGYIVVTGYRERQIREFVGRHYPGLAVTFLNNEQYEETNNIYSLWLTREHVTGDALLLLDSDIVFDSAILTLLLTSDRDNCLAVLTRHPLGDEEIKVRCGADGAIVEIGKHVDPGAALGESIGIEKFGPEFVGRMFDILERKIVHRNETGQFYEAAFQEAIDAGQKVFPVDVGRLHCVEIDTPEDLAAARNLAAGRR